MAKPSATPTTQPATAGTIQLVPVKHLRESPFNPRKHYGAAALAELAESIKAQGILQPIVARDLPAGQQDIWVRHEIVFGHRRFRAAQLAGFEEVPVVLRPFTDEQAALAQVAENLQRQDVTALEEADSFQRLHRDHGMNADQIAAGVNKSRSYVYGRLKLAKMAPEVREAMADDGLPADIAIEVARMTDHALQKKALKTVREMGSYSGDGKWPSVRYTQQRLRGMYNNNVDKAPFDPNDATLAKHAGPCSSCPKRAGNDPDLQGIVDAGVCTDVSCYDFKAREHVRIEVIVMRNAGHPVISGAEGEALLGDRPQYAVPKGYQDMNGGDWIGLDDKHEHRSYAEMIDLLEKAGQSVPKCTVIAAGGVMRQFLTEAQANDVVKRADVLLGGSGGDDGTDTPSTAARAADGGGGWPYETKDLTDWTPAERAVVGDGWMRVKEAVMRNLASRPRTADDMRVILMREYDAADGFGPITEIMGLDAECVAAEQAWEADKSNADDFSYRAWWEAKLASLPADTLGVILLGASLWDFLGYGGRGYSRAQAAAKVALCERYGVDVLAASQPEVKDDAGAAGGPRAQAAAPKKEPEQLDAFGPVPA